MIRRYLRSYTFFSLLFLAINFSILSIPEQLHLHDFGGFFLLNNFNQEGFCVGTLVKTPCGYGAIEDFVVGDLVVDRHGKATEITAIARQRVDTYIKISLEDTVLCLGCDQRLCMVPDAAWVRACELFDGGIIAYPAMMYALTTQSHSLCVTRNDIGAHNADAVLLGTSSLFLGHVAVANPVVILLDSAMVALAVVAYNAYQEYVNQYQDGNSFVSVVMPNTVVFAERFYYESRKIELEKIRQELLVIKNDLEKIHGLCSGDFTYQFLNKHTWNTLNNVLLVSIAQEKNLSNEQKLKLRQARENELALLEKQIQDIQLLLALHVNQLVDNINESKSVCDDELNGIEQAITAWNNSDSLTSAIALQVYKKILLQDYLIQNLRQCFDELIIVGEYYRACKSECIWLSTNIIETLERILPMVSDQRLKIDELELFDCKNIAVVERYLASRNISVMALKNEIIKDLAQKHKEREVQVLKKVESDLAGSGSPGGPKKDDDEDDKDFWEALKARSDKRARSVRFGKMYRDPITKLWWSKDLSGHGGSCYKVFKEGSKGFELLFDAAKGGVRMLNKHKGPIGVLIPYKEVVFRT